MLASEGYNDDTDPRNNVRPEKVISETAILVFAASRARQDEELASGLRQIATLLIPCARSHRIALGICLEPARALEYALAHICLKRLGYEDWRFDKVLREARRSQAQAGIERVSHRWLEQEWLAREWECSPSGSLRRDRHPPSTSILAQPMELLAGSREDVYAFTHALMYVTDFNVHPKPLPRRRALITVEAESALARCLDDQDYDLGAELLLAWPLTGRSWSPGAAFGFRVLAHIEDKVGFLPAASTRVNRLDELKGDARHAYFLATAYHTIYVMGLLCAIALQPGRAPPTTLGTGMAREGAGATILKIIDADAVNTHWRDEVEKLAPRDRDSIASLLFSIAIHRNVKRRNFAGLYQLLLLGKSLNLLNSPTASQAAEMLKRLALFSEIMVG